MKRILIASLLLASCATAEIGAQERAYQQCLDDRRTHAVAWEVIEAECRKEAFGENKAGPG
jgi:hypothetical protein